MPPKTNQVKIVMKTDADAFKDISIDYLEDCHYIIFKGNENT